MKFQKSQFQFGKARNFTYYIYIIILIYFAYIYHKFIRLRPLKLCNQFINLSTWTIDKNLISLIEQILYVKNKIQDKIWNHPSNNPSQYIFNYSKMGALCVQQYRIMNQIEKKNNPEYQTKLKKQKRDQAFFSPYGKVIHAYMRQFGKNPCDQTKKFIQENYNPSYRSSVKMLGSYSPSYTSKQELIDRLKSANQNRLINFYVDFIEVNTTYRTLKYNWTYHKRNQKYDIEQVIDLKCTALFDQQSRLLKLEMQQYDPKHEQKQRYMIYQEKKQTKIQDTHSNLNNYCKAPSSGVDYNAQIQRSNQQFRERMNKQAQQWNNYANTQNRLNRGY